MALAGGSHVVIPVRSDFDWPTKLSGSERGYRTEDIHLRFLASESASQPPHLNRDRVGGNAKHLSNHMLGLAWMLRRGLNQHVLVFTRNGKGDLAFQIHVILAADPHLPLEPLWSICKAFPYIPPLQFKRFGNIGIACFPGSEGVDLGGKGLVGDLGGSHCLAGMLPCFCHYGKQGLAQKLHLFGGKHRFIIKMVGADVVIARRNDVVCRKDTNHALHDEAGGEIHIQNLGVRLLAEPNIGMQRAYRLSRVIGIICLTGHMLMG